MTEQTLASANRRPAQKRFGKDHLTLADWPIGVATFQQRREKEGQLRDYATFMIERSGGQRQQVTLESPSRIGLPTAGDKDVVIALLYLAKQQGFSSDVLRFMPSQLVHVVGWQTNQKSFERLKRSLKRLKAMTATYENVWYSRRTRTVEAMLVTGILAEVNLVFRKGRRVRDAQPESYIQWTKNIYESLEEGNLIDLDLDLYFSCSRPGAKDLLRHLNKVWHGGRKPKPYARDLRELACGHLGLTDSKDLKRNFQQLVEELEARQYLQPTAAHMRYQKIAPGIWRVHFDLHPDRLRSTKSQATARMGTSASPTVESDAAELVRRYHQHRFAKSDHKPQSHELAKAAMLLQTTDSQTLLALMPTVARTVERSFHNQDVFFGAAVPYYEKAVAGHQRHELSRTQAKREQKEHAAVDRIAFNEKQQRQEQRQLLLEKWRLLTEEKQRRYHQQAIDHAASEFDRRRLICSRHTDEPPMEVLQMMAGDLRAASDKVTLFVAYPK